MAVTPSLYMIILILMFALCEDICFAGRAFRPCAAKKPHTAPQIHESDRPPGLEQSLTTEGLGQIPISSIQICRTPVRNFNAGLINVLTGGMLESQMKQKGYRYTYHAYMIINDQWVVHKATDVKIQALTEHEDYDPTSSKRKKDTHCLHGAPDFGRKITLNDVFQEAEAMNPCLYEYIFYFSNCQDFIWTMVQAIYSKYPSREEILPLYKAFIVENINFEQNPKTKALLSAALRWYDERKSTKTKKKLKKSAKTLEGQFAHHLMIGGPHVTQSEEPAAPEGVRYAPAVSVSRTYDSTHMYLREACTPYAHETGRKEGVTRGDCIQGCVCNIHPLGEVDGSWYWCEHPDKTRTCPARGHLRTSAHEEYRDEVQSDHYGDGVAGGNKATDNEYVGLFAVIVCSFEIMICCLFGICCYLLGVGTMYFGKDVVKMSGNDHEHELL